jgi:poly(3-hydroxybutyrate) depolymerase
MRILLLIFVVLAPRAHGGTRLEQNFKDPVTGKSGLYTAGFETKAAPKSQGLLLFFHGSGNTQGYASAFETLAAAGRDHNLVPVALQAPNQAVTWPEGPNAPNNRHVEYVASFLEKEIFAKHPEVRRDRLIFAGFSAGSTFLSGDFLPAHIRQFQGGAVMLCGGGGPVRFPQDVFRKLTPDEALKFPLAFMIQKKDFLYHQAMQGVSYWKSRQALVHADTPEGGGHCAFDFGSELSKGIRKILEMSRSSLR